MAKQKTENTGTPRRQIRVAVVDGDENMRLSLKSILQSWESFTFAGGFSSGKEALTGIPCLRPDLAVLDVKLPDVDGIECTRRLRQFMPSLKVIILSENRDTESLERTLDAGAVAYLIKPVNPDQLIATLRFHSARSNKLLKAAATDRAENATATLSAREIAILDKLAEGLLYKEISGALGISYSAVRKSQNRIFRKFQVSNRSEAIRIWLNRRSQ